MITCLMVTRTCMENMSMIDLKHNVCKNCWSEVIYLNPLHRFITNLRKKSSAVLYIYFEARESVSSEESKHIYLSETPNWIGPCQVCVGQCANGEQSQGSGAVSIKIKDDNDGKHLNDVLE